MQESETDGEKSTDRPAEKTQSNRKNRTTPRQLWKSSQEANRQEASRRLKVRPIDEVAEEPEEPALQEEDQTPDASPDADPAEDGESKSEKKSDEQPPETPEETPSAAEAEEEPKEGEPEDDAAGPAPEPPRGTEQLPGDPHPEQEADARMVNSDQQPGMMRYPYATHGPAPEDGEGAGGDRMVSSSFVLGLLIIAGALLTGFALIAQHRQMAELEGRIERLESAVASQSSGGDLDVESARR